MTDRRACALLGLLVTLWTAPLAWGYATRNDRTTADEPQYLLSATSLFEDRSLDIADERAAGRYRVYHPDGLPLQEAVQRDGSRVSPHDPLLPALLAVPVGLGGWLAAKLFLAVVGGALAAITAWTAIVRFGVERRVALMTVAAAALAAPLAVYATQVYPEIVAALAVAVAIAAATGDLRRRGPWVALVGSVVALPWLSVKYAPVAGALAVVALARLRPARAAGTAAVLAGAAGAFVVLHLRWYGGLTPYAAGSHFTAGELTVMGMGPNYSGRATRLAGLLADRDFGLAAWNPTWLALPVALGALLRRRPAGWDVLAAPLAAGWLGATFLALTMQGWWFPGRQVIVVLPAATLAVAWWAARSRAGRIAVAAAGVVGASLFAAFVAQALAGRVDIVVRFAQTAHPWRSLARLALPDYRRMAPLDWARHAAFVAVALAAAATTFIRSHRNEEPRHAFTRSSAPVPAPVRGHRRDRARRLAGRGL